MDEAQAKTLAMKLYGMNVAEICQLNSYDDRNFLIKAEKWVDIDRIYAISAVQTYAINRNIKNSNIKSFCADGYVLKVLNSFESKKIKFIEGQVALSLYLSEYYEKCTNLIN